MFDDKKDKNYLDLKKILIVFFYENGVDLFKKDVIKPKEEKEEEKLPAIQIEEKKEEENDKMEIDDEPIAIENKNSKSSKKESNEVIEITDDEAKPEVKKKL